MTDYSVMKELTFSSRDEFTRKPIAEKIIKLLDSDIDVSPLIIDGKWGTGKTEFCFKLKNLIEDVNSSNYKVGYVNAFQADHANEPLLALIAEVASLHSNDNEKSEFIRKAIPYLRLITGVGLKAAVGFVFGKYAAEAPSILSEGVDAIKDGSSSLIDQSLESIIKDQVEAEKNLADLKAALVSISTKTPIILLIDELDRCRPDFAVMMLETIKHVFDVKNVQIILITNADQLKATIKHSYGSETNSHDYLYKFFKYQINLPTATKDTEGKSVENNVTHFKTIVQASNVIPQDFKNNQFIYEIPTFLDLSKLSLRNIEQIVRCIETLIIFEDKDKSKSLNPEPLIMVFLSFIYISDKDLFMRLANKELVASDFLDFMSSSILTIPDDNILDNATKSFILILFNKLIRNQVIRVKSGSGVEMQKLAKTILDGPHNTLLIDNNGINSDSYLYNYIEHTINNLLLFKIVK